VAVTASQVFSFLEQHQTCSIERREIHSDVFGALRRSIRSIVVRLSEDGDTDSQEAADRLRILLSEWLTVPVRFDGAMLESVAALGDPESIERRWGSEIRTAFDFASVAARAIRHVENPARAQVHDARAAPPGVGATAGKSTATGAHALTLTQSSRMRRSRPMPFSIR